MIVPVSASYAVITALLMLALAYRVSGFRLRDKIGLGDQGSHDLQIAVRSHANLMEYAPLFLIMLFIGELNGIPVNWLNWVGALFVLSRFAHAWGMVAGNGGTHPGRFLGIAGTWLGFVALAGMLLVNLMQFRVL